LQVPQVILPEPPVTFTVPKIPKVGGRTAAEQDMQEGGIRKCIRLCVSKARTCSCNPGMPAALATAATTCAAGSINC